MKYRNIPSGLNISVRKEMIKRKVGYKLEVQNIMGFAIYMYDY